MTPEREQFVRDNALSIVSQLEAQVERQRAELKRLSQRCESISRERQRLRDAIAEHHAQKADDRCWMDDRKLYEAAGLPTDNYDQIGSPSAMLANCERFVTHRCSGGGPWVSYAELEAERDRLLQEQKVDRDALVDVQVYCNMVRTDSLRQQIQETLDLLPWLRETYAEYVSQSEEYARMAHESEGLREVLTILVNAVQTHMDNDYGSAPSKHYLVRASDRDGVFAALANARAELGMEASQP